MSIWSLLAGWMVQGMLGYFLFMAVAFWASGLANGRNFPAWQTRVLNLSMLLVPGACVVMAGWLGVRYFSNQPAPAWWWHALPLAGFALFALFASWLGRRPRD